MELKICSFNSRCARDRTKDGINNFFERTERIREFIERESPDVIGLQEITDVMREWYIDALEDYYIVGGGRDADFGGESSAIAFKKRDMQLISVKTEMLSSEPNKQGSRYEGSDQSVCPRVYTRAYFKHKDIKTPFYVYNVHTDHKGSLARKLASMQMVRDVCSHDEIFFMTGDFNATPETDEIGLLTSLPRIVDVTENIERTFHQFGRLSEEQMSKIDYIFADSRASLVRSWRVEDEPKDGVYISDHYPILAIFELE